MRRVATRLFRAACWFSALWLWAATAEAAPVNDDPLVDGVLARAYALVSGRLEYHLTDGFSKRNQTIHDSGFKFSLMGDSWALRNAAAPGIQINHRGMMLMCFEGTTDGEARRSATIYNREAIDRHRPCSPYFAGTLWYRDTVEFIDAHRSEKTARAGALREGVPTEIVEWRLDKKHSRAFGPRPRSLSKGGTLRLHVAPALGYALPLIECLTPGGKVEEVFESADFFEAGPGFFLPRRCELRSLSEDTSYYVKYKITSAELINEEVPEDDFQIYLPPGTNVADSRTPGGATVFRVGEIPVLPGNLQDIIQLTPRDRRPWLRAALIGAGGGLAFVAVLALVRKLRGRQSRGP